MSERVLKRVLVTGGAGFIGSALVRYLVKVLNLDVLNVDKLTYAADLRSLECVEDQSNYSFLRADICDRVVIRRAIQSFMPDAVMHLAAESHVDRSIDYADDFIKTNVLGTFVLLDLVREYWQSLSEVKKKNFCFHHVSTDEVFGDLGDEERLFDEQTLYRPSSPYSASKAAADHFVRAWGRTYGLPILVTNCSNNYGPYQFPEKLIPLMILNALETKPLPVYGNGLQVRDWLHVDDHVMALYQVLTRGSIGETYNIGGNNQKKNIDIVLSICDILDELSPLSSDREYSYKSYIRHIKDRPGHDRRYAVNTSKIKKELGWSPSYTFETGLRHTVNWYLNNLGRYKVPDSSTSAEIKNRDSLI